MSTQERTIRIHTTERQVFKACRLRWWFSSESQLGFKPKKAAPALSFGTAWHKGLEAYYAPSPAPLTIDDAKAAFQSSVLGWFQKLTNPTEEEEAEYTESHRLGLGMLDHYAPFALKHDDFEVVWTERTFEIPLLDAIYTATPDALVRDEHDRLWVMEHKSAKDLPQNTDYLLMDEQVGSYLWAIGEATGEWPEGVIYNIARKKLPTPLRLLKSGQLSMDARTDTTYEYALAQITEHYDGVPARYYDFLEMLRAKRTLDKNNNGFFLREHVRRNRNEIRILAEHIEMEAREMLNPDLPIYRNPSKFNCSNCAYVGPCLAKYEGSDYMQMLEGNYDHA